MMQKFNQLPEFVAFLKRNGLTEITTPKQQQNGTIQIAYPKKQKVSVGCFSTKMSQVGFTIHSNGYVRNVKGQSSVIRKYASIKTEKQFLVAIEMLQNLIDKRTKSDSQYKFDSMDMKSLFNKIKKDLNKVVRRNSSFKDYTSVELNGKSVTIDISRHNSVRSKIDGYQIRIEIKKINKTSVTGTFHSPRHDSRLKGNFNAPLGAIPQEIERIIADMKKAFNEINKEAKKVEMIARRVIGAKILKGQNNYWEISQKVSEIAQKEGFSEHVAHHALRRLKS